MIFSAKCSCRPTVAEVLDGKITTINFAPSDPTCVERAIIDMKLAIDRKVSGCCGSLAATY